MLSEKSSQALESVQVLRAVAALMVIVFHALGTHAAPDSAGILNSGVDLFFVISGFIMVWISREGTGKPASFLRSRIVRIVPLYWVATFLWLPVIVVRGETFPTPHEVFASLTFIPYFNQSGDAVPVLGLGWTLNYEMLFYLVFAATMFLGIKRQLLVIAVLFTALVALRPIIGETSGAAFRFTSPLLFEFIMGALVALVATKIMVQSWITGTFCICVGVTALIGLSEIDGLPRFASQGAPHVLILCGALMLERYCRLPALRPLRVLGDASYSLYLFHPFALTLLPITFPPVSNPGWNWLLVFAAIALGLAAHWVVERPLMRAFRKKVEIKAHPVSG